MSYWFFFFFFWLTKTIIGWIMDRENFILVSNKQIFLHKLYNYTSKKATLLVFLDFQKKKNYINVKNNNVSSYFLDFQKKKKIDIVFYSYIFLL